MKPILIDEFIKDISENQEEISVVIEGQTFEGYQIAKPLNYESEYLSIEERQEMANAVLEGKAIAVRFFRDLNDKEKVEYIKSQIN